MYNPSKLETEVASNLRTLNKENAKELLDLMREIFPDGRFVNYSRIGAIDYIQTFGRVTQYPEISDKPLLPEKFVLLQRILNTNLFIEYETLDAQGQSVCASTLIIMLDGNTRFAQLEKGEKTIGIYITNNKEYHSFLLLPLKNNMNDLYINLWSKYEPLRV